MKPIVAIVGRPNVGKSTLFNRILGRKKAIVADEPGVTRDLNFADVEELGRAFTIVDTGGFESLAADVIQRQVREQATVAIEDSDAIVFLMDGRTGPTADDEELVAMLRKVGKPVVYAVNKVDSDRLCAGLGDFYALGLKEVLPVSAEHGRGVNELIDAVVAVLPEKKEEEAPQERVKVALVGRPNAGKSSLLNRLIGKPRAIVSEVAGTTRDSIDTPFDIGERKYLFIDTAGIRKKNRVSMVVETYCVMEAIKSIERCDVAVLVIDGKEGVKGQDEKIASIIEDRKRCCILAVNKWDIVEKDSRTIEYAEKTMRQSLPFLDYAPMVFISALTGQRVLKVIETADDLVRRSAQKLSTSAVNSALEGIAARRQPPAYRGREVKFYYATQTSVSPPGFVIFANHPEGVDTAYRRHLVDSLRDSLGLDGVPIKLFFRKRH